MTGARPRIIVTGFLVCESLDEADMVSHLVPSHLAATNAEPGCIGAEIWRSMADPVRFAVRAIFRDREAFDRHRALREGSDWWARTRHIARDYRLTLSAISGDDDARGESSG